MNNIIINSVTDGIMKNSPVIVGEESKIFIFHEKSNEHFEISKTNCKSVEVINSTDDFIVLDILWITDDHSEITADRELYGYIRKILY